MHDDSQRILQALANGQEVLGINAAYLSTGLRRAFADGAKALALVGQMRAVLLADAAPAEQPADSPAIQVQPTTSTKPEPVVAAPETSEPTAPAPAAAVPAQQAPAAEVPLVVAESAPAIEEPHAQPAAETPAAVEPVAAAQAPAAVEPVAAAQAPAQASAYIEDDRPEPLPSQSDDPDADGWRPSEDSMLLDEFVGLGLSLEEVAENHGRSVRDIALRLKQRHGISVEVPAEAAPPAAVATPTVEREVLAPAVPEAAVPAAPSVPVAPAPAPAANPPTEPTLEDYEAVIAQEMQRAGPEAVHFATGVLRHMDRAPSAVAQLQDYLQTPKARTKLNDRLRLALLAKVVARLKTA